MNFPAQSPLLSSCHPALPLLGLGIDAGGTQTRWALATHDEQIVASGNADGLSALQAHSASGMECLEHVFSSLAAIASCHGLVHQVYAGITGFGGDLLTLPHMMSHLFQLPESNITVSNDVEIAYLDIFRPGTGYLLYAGTGSIAAYIDEEGHFLRAGGRGYLLDDAGGGFWIAKEAMRHIWRQEDEKPHSWHDSPMAKNIFAKIGGSDWNHSRDYIYHCSRGEIGKLAIAVASAADKDAVAMEILKNAGKELARLGTALCHRYGPKPMALSGRVQELHPVIIETLRAHLPPEVSLRRSTSQPHFSAARLAARQLALSVTTQSTL